MPNSNDGSGIKCLKLEGRNSCIFKDKKNFVHIIDLLNRSDYYYNISRFEEQRKNVPSIGDIDGDGNPEAVFWLNQNDVSGYGIAVFDLKDKRLDPVFNGKGYVDDLFDPKLTNEFGYLLKGSPVLVDLNNDGKMEIFLSATIMGNNADSFLDKYTKLFAFNFCLAVKVKRSSLFNTSYNALSVSMTTLGSLPSTLDRFFSVE